MLPSDFRKGEGPGMKPDRPDHDCGRNVPALIVEDLKSRNTRTLGESVFLGGSTPQMEGSAPVATALSPAERKAVASYIAGLVPLRR
jgi:hypothetical protein